MRAQIKWAFGCFTGLYSLYRSWGGGRIRAAWWAFNCTQRAWRIRPEDYDAPSDKGGAS